MSEANIDQNRDNVKHTGHVSATRALREPRYSIIDLQKAYAEGRAEAIADLQKAYAEGRAEAIADLQKAYAEGRAEAIAQERERVEKAVEAAWTTHGAISQAVVLRIIRDSPDTGATTGGES